MAAPAPHGFHRPLSTLFASNSFRSTVVFWPFPPGMVPRVVSRGGLQVLDGSWGGCAGCPGGRPRGGSRLCRGGGRRLVHSRLRDVAHPGAPRVRSDGRLRTRQVTAVRRHGADGPLLQLRAVLLGQGHGFRAQAPGHPLPAEEGPVPRPLPEVDVAHDGLVAGGRVAARAHPRRHVPRAGAGRAPLARDVPLALARPGDVVVGVPVLAPAPRLPRLLPDVVHVPPAPALRALPPAFAVRPQRVPAHALVSVGAAEAGADGGGGIGAVPAAPHELHIPAPCGGRGLVHAEVHLVAMELSPEEPFVEHLREWARARRAPGGGHAELPPEVPELRHEGRRVGPQRLLHLLAHRPLHLRVARAAVGARQRHLQRLLQLHKRRRVRGLPLLVVQGVPVGVRPQGEPPELLPQHVLPGSLVGLEQAEGGGVIHSHAPRDKQRAGMNTADGERRCRFRSMGLGLEGTGSTASTWAENRGPVWQKRSRWRGRSALSHDRMMAVTPGMPPVVQPPKVTSRHPKYEVQQRRCSAPAVLGEEEVCS